MSTLSGALLRIVKDARLSGQSLRVLLFLYASVEYGAFSPVTPAIIASELLVHQSSVKRTIRTLIELGYIKKRHETGKLVGYEMVEE